MVDLKEFVILSAQPLLSAVLMIAGKRSSLPRSGKKVEETKELVSAS
jgi:hypothetical protein